MKVILSSVYCGNIQYFSTLKDATEIWIEINDHFEKQSYRNRTEIYGANGNLKLSIPLEKRGKRMPTNRVKIDNSQNWQKIHWRSWESAYRCSPYFEYYEDHFAPFYEKEYTCLTDFNMDLFKKTLEMMKIDTPVFTTKSYEKVHPEEYLDLRGLVKPKTNSSDFPKEHYVQVFDEKYGYLPNLSFLDLLFNQGPRAIGFL